VISPKAVGIRDSEATATRTPRRLAQSDAAARTTVAPAPMVSTSLTQRLTMRHTSLQLLAELDGGDRADRGEPRTARPPLHRRCEMG